MDSIKIMLLESLIMILTIFLLIMLFTSPFYSCREKAKKMGIKYEWGLYQGCMVETSPKEWVSIENYKIIKQTN
jgi:hypothetical protein